MTLLSFALRADRLRLVIALAASVASGFAGAALMGYIGRQFTSQDNLGPLTIVAFAALIVFSVGAGLAARWLLVELVSLRTLKLQMELSRRIVVTPLPQVEAIERARLFAVLTDDARAVSDALMRIPEVVISTALVAGSIAYLLWLSPLAASVLVLVAVPVVLFYRRLNRRVARLLKVFFRVRDERYGQYDGLTMGTKELQVDPSLRSRFVEAMGTKGELFRRTHARVLLAHEVANTWSQAAYFVFVLVLLVLIRSDVVGGDILGAYALIALYIRGAIVQITAVIPVWVQANTALARIDSLDLAPDPGEDSVGRSPAADVAEVSDVSAGDEIVIRAEQLSFRYPTPDGYGFGLEPIDLELRSGELIFITGGNGSGKTTLMKLLCALYEPSGGTLSCNGEPVVWDGAADDRDAYRQRISALFADGYLFEELLGMDDQSADGTEAANRFLAELDLADKVEVVDGHLSTTALSTGQRRRLALLGAFLRDRQVYAFDEWAANQDPIFKRFFYRTLLPELRRRGKLVLVISHDDAYFDGADRILQLSEGRLDAVIVPSASSASASAGPSTSS
ncbi:MAG: cyclic peptide export ABC transporter [Actinomycetota bacterium]